ncbi:MAG: TolC family outer membrane protein, partial [Nitrospinota bacterium]
AIMDIYRLALENDAGIAAAEASLAAGRETIVQGRSLLMPSINLGADYTKVEMDISYSDPFFVPGGLINYISKGYTLSLIQPLFRMETLAVYAQAKLMTHQSEIEHSLARQELILIVARAYFEVLMAEDNLNFIHAQKEAIAEQLAHAKLAFEIGRTSITDTHEAQARFDLVKSQEILAENRRHISRESLQKIIDEKPGRIARLSDKLPLEPPDSNEMEYWVEKAEQNNLRLKIVMDGVMIAKKEMERNRGARYPALNIVAAYDFESADGGPFNVGSDTATQTVGLQLNMPLFTGGGLSSKIRAAQANYQKALYEKEDALRMVRLQTRETFLLVKSGISQVLALQQALLSSRSSMASTKRGFEVGMRTGVDVLNAQQQFFRVKRDLAQTRYGYLLSRLQLKAIAGILKDEDIEEINGLLEKK